jgi:hypothetical protein
LQTFLQKVFVFAKIFAYAHVFANFFVFLKPSAKNEIFQIILGNIHQCFGSGYTFSWLLDPDPHSEWKIFAKTKKFGENTKTTKYKIQNKIQKFFVQPYFGTTFLPASGRIQ